MAITASDILANLKTLLDKVYLRKKLSNADEILVTNSSKEVTTTSTIGASKVSGLKTVATTGDYNDLTNKPTIPAAYTHPAYTGTNSKDLYKISVDSLGHVSETTKVTSTDIGSLHPSYTSRSSGLYKITVDNTGHVSNVSTMSDTDWTNQNITSSNIKHENVTVSQYLNSIDQQLVALSSSSYENGVLSTGKSSDSYTNGLLVLT